MAFHTPYGSSRPAPPVTGQPRPHIAAQRQDGPSTTELIHSRIFSDFRPDRSSHRS